MDCSIEFSTLDEEGQPLQDRRKGRLGFED